VTSTGWEAGFAERARDYWTAERTAQLAGDKTLLLPPGEAAPLLRALGLLHRDASLPPAQHRKYFQVSHMVATLRPAMRELAGRHPRVHLLDAGCGRSYLTLVLAWVARRVWGLDVRVLGVDRNPAIIDECRRRTALAGMDDTVHFAAAPLDGLDVQRAWADMFGDSGGTAGIHGVIALHACDTATCDAIVLGVQLRAELLALAPCCQAELARAWSAGGGGAFAPVWQAPHLRREIAAHVTDTMRTLLLRAAGYQVWPIEFVPSEHTRKNTLIRAMHRGVPDPAARAEYEALRVATGGAGIGLAGRL
jgi:SAM-dependent methyltransferase